MKKLIAQFSFTVLLIVGLSCRKDPQIAHADESQNYTVTTFAGNGTNGMDPGTGGLALLNFPCGIDTDDQGNVYVADTYNHKIRMITPSGGMTTLAGSTPGYQDGTGSSAKFNNPILLTVDEQGYVFVVEAGSYHIRKITPAGVVTTIAGDGNQGFLDGIGTAARIDIPGGITHDGHGNIYFTQKDFHGIRKITPDGVVSSFVGSDIAGNVDGTGSAARFNEPLGLTSDAQDNIYVSDHSNSRIRKVTTTGVVTTLFTLSNPSETGTITTDAQGNFYITQGGNAKSKLSKISPAGVISGVAGNELGYADGTGNVAMFSYLAGVTIDSQGTIYLVDLGNNLVRKIRRN